MKKPMHFTFARLGWKAGTLALAGLLAAVANTPAQVWTNINEGTASGLWSTAASWSPNAVPNAQDAIADFSTLTITNNSFITNDAFVSVGTLLFANSTANGRTWTLDGASGNLINLEKSSGIPTIGVTNVQALIGGLTGYQGFEKTGNGALAIYGGTYGNNVSGPIYVNGGLLGTVSGAAFTGISGDIIVANGASFSANGRFDGYPVLGNIYISGSGSSASGYVNNPITPDGTYNGEPQPMGALDIYGNGIINGTVTLVSDARITHGWNNATINGPVTVTNAGQNLELAIVVGGQGPLVINNTITLGTGALKITGAPGSAPVVLGAAPNTYAGGTIINGGRLVLTFGSPDSMDTTSGLTFTAGGELDLNGNSQTLPFLSGSGGTITDRDAIFPGATVLTVNQSTATTFTGKFEDGTARTLYLVKDGAGSLTLGGLSTHTGPTTVNAGALLGRSGGGCVNSIVQLANGTTNGYVATIPGGQWSCAGLIYDAGTTYLQYDFGIQAVDTSYPSPMPVNGDVAINGTLNLAVTGGIWVNTGTYPLLTYTGSLTPAPTINLTGLPAGVTATLVNDTANKRIALVVTAIPPVVFPGASDGVWTSLAYNNSDPTNGVWSLTNNWLNGVVASGAGATADFTTLDIATNSLVVNDAPRSVTKLLFARPTPANNISWTFSGGAANHLTLASVTLDQPVITVSNVTALVGGIDGSQGFVKEGNGVLAIYGNTYGNNVAGLITVKAGLLASVDGAAFANIGSGPDGRINVEAGASLGINSRYDGVPVTVPIYLSGTGGTPTGYYNNAPTLDLVPGNVFGGSTAPFGALDVYGNGLVNGPIYLLTDSKITHSWDFGFINGPIIGTNKNLEIRTYQGGQADLQIGSSISLGTGTLTINGTGNQGVRLNNANEYTGGTILNSGKLRVGNVNAVNGGALTINGGYVDMFGSAGLLVSSLSGASGSAITDRATVTGEALLTVDQSVATTYSGNITNGTTRLLALTKAGTGELALAGINTYSGATTVSGGRLIGVTGGSSSNSVHQIADGATNGVKLATAGSQWVCAGLTYDGGGNQSLAADFGFITPSTTTAPLLVNGAVAFDGTVTVRISGQFVGTGSYPLVKATGGITGAPAGVVLPPAMTGNVQVIGDTVWLNVLTNTNTPPAQPTILPVYNDGLGNIVIRTVTELNHNYLLQSTTNLNYPIVWVTISSTAGTGGTITSTVPVSTTPPNKFFRYQAQ